MTAYNPDQHPWVHPLLDVLLRVGLIAVLAVFCYGIFHPFLSLMLWSITMASEAIALEFKRLVHARSLLYTSFAGLRQTLADIKSAQLVRHACQPLPNGQGQSFTNTITRYSLHYREPLEYHHAAAEEDTAENTGGHRFWWV